MKKILYLSYTGLTDPLGQSQVLAYLNGLSKTAAYRFFIISFEKEKPFRQLQKTIEKVCEDANIEWHPLPYTAKPPVLSTFRDVRRMKALALKLAKTESFSLVHCRSYIPSLVGLHLKEKLGIPFLFDMRGFWADERLDGGIWNQKHLLYKFIYNYFKKKEKDFLLNADHIISLTQNAKDEIHSWKLRPVPLHITVIPCCADLQLFNPANVSDFDRQQARRVLGISEDAPVVSYVGSLGTWYMLDEMVAFVKQYQKKFTDAIFMVLTGEPEQMILEAAERGGLDKNCIRVKKVARAEMPVYISLSAISIFFIKPAYSKKASSPVKQGELMAMGVPVVCNNAVGDTEEIVEEYKAGIIVKDFSRQAYVTAIDKLENGCFDTKKIMEGAEAFFSLERGVQLYQGVYEIIGDE